MEVLNNLIELATSLITDGGWIVGFILVLIESFLPILPLGAFVTLNVNAFGFQHGILLSWIATTIGSYLTYLFFYYLSNNLIFRLVKEKTRSKIIEKTVHFKEIKMTHLVLLITLPFAPSCFINLLAGVTGIAKKKYLISLLIGKIFMVMFWSFIGKSFIESLTNIKAIIFIIIILMAAYFITKYISKKLKIE